MPPEGPVETAVNRDIDDKLRFRPTDGEVGRVAERQFGVVSRRQLLELGLSRDAIDSRLASGRLYRLHRGVYSVGHRIVPREGRWLAAVLRAGEGAVLSNASAAALWGVRRERSVGPIHVATARSVRSPAGLRCHCQALNGGERTTRRRIPVTTLARTLFDLAGETSAEGLEGAIREAEYLHRFRIQELEALLLAHPRRRGAVTLKACLHRVGRGPRGRTRSELENRFAALLAETDLPQPELNTLLDFDDRMYEVDCVWRAHRLIVELDGLRAHGTRSAFESDRDRDRRLQVAGWRVLHLTWNQLQDPLALTADLRHLIASSPQLSAK